MTALCAHILVDRGLLDLDAPLSQCWPEFAQAGKENLPVRYLLSHQSGLSGFEESFPVETLCDWDQCIKLLAAQKPWWEPGTQSDYHAISFGYLVGEAVRRISNQTLGTFFREEVAVPLNADFHIGLSEEHDPRVGELIPPPELVPEGFEIDPNSIFAKTFRPPTPLSLRGIEPGGLPKSRRVMDMGTPTRSPALLPCWPVVANSKVCVYLLYLPSKTQLKSNAMVPTSFLEYPFAGG